MRSLALVGLFLPEFYDEMLFRCGLKVVQLELFKRSDFERRRSSRDLASSTEEAPFPLVGAYVGEVKEQSGNRWRSLLTSTALQRSASHSLYAT